ncbi:metallophosphoesterase [Rhizobium leguminosarum]|uniref:metallophosphoesterase n=1 Tax=Rhizobium leguminosarum TaxID=384 RepID=UPI0010322BB8|nr:metallophosphoesterase [Rhizobium leguminosarum]TAV52903.1 hypothetical protein ELI29_07240 [Rhizobium leguminosarum]
MKAWIFSDLHTQLHRSMGPLPVPEADVCICAGNICADGPASAVGYLGEHVSRMMPVILVAGNRDYYRSTIVEGGQEALARTTKFPNVFFLDRGMAVVRGVRFVGATLWGDTELLVTQRLALFVARRHAEDFLKLKMSKRPSRRLSSAQLATLSREDRDFLRQALETPNAGPTVVVTHHAPSSLSIPPELLAEALCPQLGGELEGDILRHQPTVWVHGNLSSRSDYRIAATRVICNPRGYPGGAVRDFDPRLVIDLADHRSALLEGSNPRPPAVH